VRAEAPVWASPASQERQKPGRQARPLHAGRAWEEALPVVSAERGVSPASRRPEPRGLRAELEQAEAARREQMPLVCFPGRQSCV